MSIIPMKVQNKRITIETPNRRIRYNGIYREILFFIQQSKGHWLGSYFGITMNVKEPRRTLIYHLNELIRLKWIMKIGKCYYLHPLLEWILENLNWYSILEYANYKIDFIKLLNEPLKHIKNPIEFEMKFIEQKATMPKLDPFNGYLIIKAKMKDGLKIQTILPYNLHHQHGFGGDIPHYCIPIKKELFNIQASYFSGNKVFIHFDDSLTISYKRRNAIWWTKRHPHYLIEITDRWSGEGNEYLEADSPETIEKLFTLRFRDGLTGIELFNALGLEVKEGFGRPKKKELTF